MNSFSELCSLSERSSYIHSPEIYGKPAIKYAFSVQSAAVQCSLHSGRCSVYQVGAVFIACRCMTLSVAMTTGEVICQQNVRKLSPFCRLPFAISNDSRVRRLHTVFISKHHVTRNASVDRGRRQLFQVSLETNKTSQ